MKFHNHKISNKKKKLQVILAVAILMTSLALIFQEAYYQYKIRCIPPLHSSELHPFIIHKGELPGTVSSRLEKEGFIDSSWVFLRYAKRAGDAEKFQAGKFYLHKKIPYVMLSDDLTEAAIDELSVTIPEGFTNQEIDNLLTRMDLIEKGDFLECIENCDLSEFPFLPEEAELREGFFFPDTYFVVPTLFNTETFTKRLLATFDEKTKSIFGKAERNGWDILKMASIIEKESKDTDERPIVSGILWKRLDNNWMLGVDATTRYALGKKTDPLTVKDLESKSPWNLRASHGLPPGAICNPGLSSIWAAVTPEESEYWYYLHGGNGEIHYAKTAEEHGVNKADFL